MGGPTCSEAEFIALFEQCGPSQAAKRLGTTVRAVFLRRRDIENRTGRLLVSPTKALGSVKIEETQFPGRLSFTMESGHVLFGSDAHYWPGIVSTAHRAFLWACKEFKPQAIILGGDELDGASISRHPPIGWEKHPSLVDEIEAVKERLGEITLAGGKAKRFWCLGNHDARFETRLATVAPEYAKIHGVHLKDHFPDYEACWSVWINDDVVCKHRFKGGIHATHNNTLWAGKTMVTGHLHSQKATPFTDFNGTRWGVDAGTMADPFGPQFEYQEDNPRNHRSGFCMLSWENGELLQPELIRVLDEHRIDFRGKAIHV